MRDGPGWRAGWCGTVDPPVRCVLLGHETMQTLDSERRRERRSPVSGQAGVSWQDGDGHRQFSSVRGLDISPSGLRVASPLPIKVGVAVWVNAWAFGFSGSAQVRRCQQCEDWYDIGLEFRTHKTDAPGEALPEEFTDYYGFLQIDPRAEADTVQRVYKMLAARYHPDNKQTGDAQKFLLLQKAHEVLSDPALRAAYDIEYEFQRTGPMPIFELKDFVIGIDAETNRRLGILCLLYERRRANPDSPGLSLLEFEQLMTIPREHLVFTVWFLKEKQLLRTGENSAFEITAAGVEFVEQSLPSNRLIQKLLRAPSEKGSPVPDTELQ